MATKPKDYKQTDKRWKNERYATKGENSTVGGSGCGPTCAAMLVATLADPKVTPLDACRWSMRHGHKALGQGTYYTFFPDYFAAYGMDCHQVPGSNSYHMRNTSSDKAAKKALKNGDYVIACMGPGNWTSGGHFVVLWNLQGGKVSIADPASTRADRLRNSWDKLQYEAKYYFIVKAAVRLKVTAEVAPVRCLPNRGAKKVGSLKRGQVFTADKRKGDFYRKGRHKWVNKKRTCYARVA